MTRKPSRLAQLRARRDRIRTEPSIAPGVTTILPVDERGVELALPDDLYLCLATEERIYEAGISQGRFVYAQLPAGDYQTALCGAGAEAFVPPAYIEVGAGGGELAVRFVRLDTQEAEIQLEVDSNGVREPFRHPVLIAAADHSALGSAVRSVTPEAGRIKFAALPGTRYAVFPAPELEDRLAPTWELIAAEIDPGTTRRLTLARRRYNLIATLPPAAIQPRAVLSLRGIGGGEVSAMFNHRGHAVAQVAPGRYHAIISGLKAGPFITLPAEIVVPEQGGPLVVEFQVNPAPDAPAATLGRVLIRRPAEGVTEDLNFELEGRDTDTRYSLILGAETAAEEATVEAPPGRYTLELVGSGSYRFRGELAITAGETTEIEYRPETRPQRLVRIALGLTVEAVVLRLNEQRTIDPAWQQDDGVVELSVPQDARCRLIFFHAGGSLGSPRLEPGDAPIELSSTPIQLALAPGSQSIALVYEDGWIATIEARRGIARPGMARVYERKNGLFYAYDTCCVDGINYLPCHAPGRVIAKAELIEIFN